MARMSSSLSDFSLWSKASSTRLMCVSRGERSPVSPYPKNFGGANFTPFFGGGKLAPPILVWGVHPKNGGDHAKVEVLSKTFCLEHILICNFQPTLHLPATISLFTLCFG